MFCPKCGNEVTSPFCMSCGTKMPDRGRIAHGLERYKPILARAQKSDINESDTVTIITDMLCDIFGYDKYENITSEFSIKRTFCDLAIKLNNKIVLLIECKAIGIALKDDHVRQATNYAVDLGTEWVVLTNGVHWKIFKIIFSKPIDRKLIYEFNLFDLDPKKQEDIELLYYLCFEAFAKSSKTMLDGLHAKKKILNPYMIGQVIMTNTCINSIQKLMKRLYPEIRASDRELLAIISNEVFKREITDGEPAVEARKAVAKALQRLEGSEPNGG